MWNQKVTNHEFCEKKQSFAWRQEINQYDEWGNCENWKALPDTTAIQKQGVALSKQQDNGREQTCWYIKKDAKRSEICYALQSFIEELPEGYAGESTKSPNDGQVWYLPAVLNIWANA